MKIKSLKKARVTEVSFNEVPVGRRFYIGTQSYKKIQEFLIDGLRYNCVTSLSHELRSLSHCQKVSPEPTSITFKGLKNGQMFIWGMDLSLDKRVHVKRGGSSSYSSALNPEYMRQASNKDSTVTVISEITLCAEDDL